MALELTKEQKQARQKVIDKYEGAKANLEALALDLRELYAIKDLENREYKLRVLKEKYGGELDVYHAQQVEIVNETKNMLTSKYYVPSPNAGLWGVNEPLLYTNNPNASAEGIEAYSGKSLTVNETRLNLLYWPELDLNSEVNVQRRENEGITLEDDIEAQNRDEYSSYFNFGTAGNTDAWGRDYDHPDFGIDPSSINRTIVTPTPVGSNNNNEVVTDTGETTTTTTTGETNEVIDSSTTGLGAEDGDLIAVNNNQEETPNRLELMTQSIKDNPSHIQQKLMDSNDLWTPERLAGLKIKHEDWKANRKNRKNLQVTT